MSYIAKPLRIKHCRERARAYKRILKIAQYFNYHLRCTVNAIPQLHLPLRGNCILHIIEIMALMPFLKYFFSFIHAFILFSPFLSIVQGTVGGAIDRFCACFGVSFSSTHYSSYVLKRSGYD